MYARIPWGSAPWAGTDVSGTAPPGQPLPPPIPGGTNRYYLTASGAAYPWAFGGWAGPALPLPTLPGGLTVAPDPATGTTRIVAWWPDVAAVRLVRVHPDGSRHPVRGAYPLVATEPTRRNYCANPSIEIGLNGYVPGNGTPTLTRLAASDAPAGGYVLRAEIASAGACEVTVPHSVPTGRVTVGVALRFVTRPTAVTVSLGWVDAVGTALATSTATLTANQVNNSVGQWARQVVGLAPPAGAVAAGSLKVAASGLPAGSTLDLDAVTVELGASAGTYLDGDSSAGFWLGTPGLSASLAAPMLTVDDGEAPLDVPVTYVLHNPTLVGGQATAPPVALASDGRTWLSHPARVTLPVEVDLRSTFDLEHDIDQGVFWPLNASRPVVKSAARRRSPTGTVAFNASSWAERDAIRSAFADGSPVLVRAPAAFGYGTGLWLALGALTESREGRKPWQDAALLSAPFVAVAAPSVT